MYTALLWWVKLVVYCDRTSINCMLSTLLFECFLNNNLHWVSVYTEFL
jgi:hypothetical protein